MSHISGLILAMASLAAITNALPNIHKQMSPHQLQSVFHVDHVDSVPAYEVVQLLHHNAADGIDAHVASSSSGRRRRRSINVVSSVLESGALKESHHVKKDLSKNPYYSELKAAAAAADTAHTGNSVYPATNEKSLHRFKDLKELKEHNVSFHAFGQNLNLTLRPTQGLFKGSPHMLPMWTVNNEANSTDGLDLQKVNDQDSHSDAEIGEVFQDEPNMAAILMRRHLETGDLIMEGNIGHEMVIKPLPHELSPSKDETHHIIYKRESSNLDHFSDFAYMEPEDVATSENLEKLQQRQRRSVTLEEPEATDEETLEEGEELIADASTTHARRRRQAPYIIYPEILVIVDYDGYRLHGGDNLQVKRYFISFWNGVDLRYRLLKGPRIRISIAGIIISRILFSMIYISGGQGVALLARLALPVIRYITKNTTKLLESGTGRDATPYLERNRVGRDAIDSAAALTDMGKYLFRERRLPVYDIAVAITKYDMCRRRKGGRCTKGTAGFAYVGGACVVNKRLEKVNSVAIIEDTGGFSGIIVAAHEVGHLLGAVHDGSPPPSYLGGPGAQRCRWEDGYIMSDLRHTERGFRWSPCTVQSFHHFLNGDTATCLHNQPHEDGALGRSLPGTLLSLDAQCRRDRGTYACFKDERVCAQLFCFDAQTGYCVAYRPAAEGSACGNGLHCLDGRCTPLPANNLNYGQNYRLVYKNTDAASNAENVENSSEEADEEDDEDANEDENDNENGEVAEEENSSKSTEEDENSIRKLRKIDNSVEETSLEVADQDNTKTTTTTTTKQPTTQYTTKQHTTQKHDTKLNTFEYLSKLLQNTEPWRFLLGTKPLEATVHNPQIVEQQPRAIIVKTSTSSSVSSKTSSSQIISSSTNGSIDNDNLAKTNNNELNEITHRTHHTHATTTPPQQQQPPPNLLQIYSTEFRKQLQYYINLIQKNSNNYFKPNISIKPISPPQSGLNATEKSQESTKNTYNLNYSVTNSNGNYNAGSNKHAAGSVEAIDDNVESNEAIEKQKRKFDDVEISTKSVTAAPATSAAESLQHQAPQHLARIPSTTQPTLTPTRRHSIIDTYFKKLQAISNNGNAALPTAAGAVPTGNGSKATLPSTVLSVKPTARTTATQEQKLFAGQFLKRTLSGSSKNHSSNSSSSNNNNHHYHHNSNSNSNKQQQSEEQLTATSPAFVTNYIGDNSNNLPAVLNAQQQEQQNVASRAPVQPHQQHTQKPQKIKTQKLVRRQLLRTQIK